MPDPQVTRVLEAVGDAMSELPPNCCRRTASACLCAVAGHRPAAQMINEKGKFHCVWKNQDDGSWKAVRDKWNADAK